MGRACEVRYNPRSKRFEIPFKNRDKGYFKRLTLEEALIAFEEEHGYPCPSSEKPSKRSKKKTDAEVLVEANEGQEDANKDDLEPSKEDN